MRAHAGLWRASQALLVLLSFGSASALAHAEDLAKADAAWRDRAEAHEEGRPQPGPILEAIAGYEHARTVSDALEPEWKLLRALHFAGEFAARSPDDARRHFKRAKEISERALPRVDEQIGGDGRLDELGPEERRRRLAAAGLSTSDVARLHFWSAINLGAWSRTAGLLGAVRSGVANRIERSIQVAIDLEPAYDEGGAYRLLGRLHAELPSVPFVTGWVDRERAIPLIERAYELAPANPGNRLLLALTLLDLAPDRRDEALALLRQVATLEPRPTMRTEDLHMRDEARARLATAEGA